MSLFLFRNFKTIKNLYEKKSDKDLYIVSFKTDLGQYDLNINLKHDKLILSCESEIEFLSVYSYSKEITFEEQKKLSNNFKSCENIEQCFTAFKNILNGISLKINNKNYESELSIEFSEEDSLAIKIIIPLIYGTYDNIEINFEKKQKNLFEQFKTLRNKYLKVKNMIDYHRCGNNYYNNEESLSTRMKKIESEEKESNSLFN